MTTIDQTAGRGRNAAVVAALRRIGTVLAPDEAAHTVLLARLTECREHLSDNAADELDSILQDVAMVRAAAARFADEGGR